MSVTPKIVNFFIIGAQKCGTTSLASALSQHPQVFMSDPKEPHFFSVPPTMKKKGFDWYHSLFEKVEKETAIGEASTSYSYLEVHPNTPNEIARYNPEARIIYLARDPLKRIISACHHFSSDPIFKRPTNNLMSMVRNDTVFLNISQYQRQLSLYYDFFPTEKIKILFFEDLVRTPQETLSDLFSFLEIDDCSRQITFPHYNKSYPQSKPKPTIFRNLPLLRRFDERVGDYLATMKQERKMRINRKDYEFLYKNLLDTSVDFLHSHGKSRDFWDFTAGDVS